MRSVLVFLFIVILTATKTQAFSVFSITTELQKKYNIPAHYTKYVLKHAKISKRVVYFMNHMPEKTMKFSKYSTLFINKSHILNGVKFFKKHKLLLFSVEREFGVNPYIITAILGIESNYGLEKPSFNALNTLYTLTKYMGKKYPFFRKELEIFIVYTYKNKINPFKIKSSYGGAIGIPQFIPSSIVEYGFDLDGGGLNLNDPDDAIGSVANYLKKNGWKTSTPVALALQYAPEKCKKLNKMEYTISELQKFIINTPKHTTPNLKGKVLSFKFNHKLHCWLVFHNFWVITRYNHSKKYAMSVYLLSKNIKKRTTQ